MAPPQKNAPDENGLPYGFASQMVTITITNRSGWLAKVVGLQTTRGLGACERLAMQGSVKRRVTALTGADPVDTAILSIAGV